MTEDRELLAIEHEDWHPLTLCHVEHDVGHLGHAFLRAHEAIAAGDHELAVDRLTVVTRGIPSPSTWALLAVELLKIHRPADAMRAASQGLSLLDASHCDGQPPRQAHHVLESLSRLGQSRSGYLIIDSPLALDDNVSVNEEYASAGLSRVGVPVNPGVVVVTVGNARHEIHWNGTVESGRTVHIQLPVLPREPPGPTEAPAQLPAIAPPTAAGPTPRSASRTGPIALVASGVVLAVGGTVGLALSRAIEPTGCGPMGTSCSPSLLAEQEQLRTGGTIGGVVSMAVGAAGIVGGAIWLQAVKLRPALGAIEVVPLVSGALLRCQWVY